MQQSPRAPSLPQPTTSPRLLSLVTAIDSKLAAAHSSAGCIIDAVNRLQAPAPAPVTGSEARDSGATVEERLETTLFIVDGLVDRLTGAAQRLDSLV